MDTDDSILLRRWLSKRDADAFVQVAMRHAKMVYSVALRILGNSHDAEEIAQECFETLASTTKPPQNNLSGWLYKVAANQAKERIRSEQRRQNREERYMATMSAELPPIPDVSWKDVYCQVDEVLLELPDIYREPLIAHFFEQVTQETIAQRLGIGRRTVSHRIQQGIDAVRHGLKKRGIPVTVVAIGTWFDAQATQITVPSARLAEQIARIGLSGVGRTVITNGSVSLLGKVGAMLNTKWVGSGIIAVLVVGAALLLGYKMQQTTEPVMASVQKTPAVIAEKEISPALPVTESSTTEGTAQTNTATAKSATPAVTPAADDPLVSLWGSWSVEVSNVGSSHFSKAGLVEIRQEASNIVIAPLNEVTLFVLTGKINGFSLQMSGKDNPLYGRPFNTGTSSKITPFFGTYTPNATSFTLEEQNSNSSPLILRFTRTAQDSIEVQNKKIKMQRREEVKAIYTALVEYSKNSGETYPERLEEVARYFKGDVGLLTSSSEREIIFLPHRLAKPEDRFSYDELHRDDTVSIPDQIVATEARLRKNGVYNYIFQPSLLTVKYTNPAQRLAIGLDRVRKSDRIIEEGYNIPLSEEDAAKFCDTCQLNLEGIHMLICLYSPLEFTLGGWAMTTDCTEITVFSCPCRPQGDDSYELLFPAVSKTAFCQELYEKVLGENADKDTAQRTVPHVIERYPHTVKGKQGRNVLFFDGHVEFVALSDLAQKVERFVKANK